MKKDSPPLPSSSQRFGQFPDGFLWGCATAAFQVEGAANEDGRGPSVWDTFCKLPGAIANDDNGEVACDHYHRYREDVGLMKDLGVKAYRFSVSWSRVFPAGAGECNPAGLDFYERLVDEILAAGIEPWMTLFHWDLPQALEDRFGGWESRDCSFAFADYAGFMAKRLGDRLAGVYTTNEFSNFLDQGYGFAPTLFAPGKKTSRKVLNQARHHAIYGHGLAVRAIRAAAPRQVPVGLAENAQPSIPMLETAEHIGAARDAFRELNGMFLTPIFEGAYPESYLETQGADAPEFTAEEMEIISTPLDFLGLNVYSGEYVRHDPNAARGWSQIPRDAGYPLMHAPWLAIAPAALYWTPRLAAELWKPGAIYITENGCPNSDRPDITNSIMDTARVMFLQQYLIQAHRCAAEGYPLKGYFIWSLMDNFEWTSGYSKRFGIHYTNYQTLERTPKLSAKYYKQVVATNACGGQAAEVGELTAS